MTYRPWTSDEDDFLRQNWRRQGVKQIASQIGRTANGIYIHAKAIGLPPLNRRNPPGIKKVIRQLHMTALTDGQIAKRLGILRRDVTYYRRLMRLPRNRKAVQLVAN